MQKFLKYSIKPTIDEKNQYDAKFTFTSLEKGFGVTLGNMLRRTMLANVPGASMFAIKIPGVTHEFQAMDGIKEDLTHVILNLKGLIVSIDEATYSDEQLESIKIEA
jgi:DNA-directed RNA polymerase subunit alpha